MPDTRLCSHPRRTYPCARTQPYGPAGLRMLSRGQRFVFSVPWCTERHKSPRTPSTQPPSQNGKALPGVASVCLCARAGCVGVFLQEARPASLRLCGRAGAQPTRRFFPLSVRGAPRRACVRLVCLVFVSARARRASSVRPSAGALRFRLVRGSSTARNVLPPRLTPDASAVRSGIATAQGA